jgi:hypothetical protein
MTLNAPLVPISWGELLDKETILEIKGGMLKSEEARINVLKELSQLNHISKPVLLDQEIASLKAHLLTVNRKLWDIEDQIRMKEASMEFDLEFIELARSVYKTNDLRAQIKKKINRTLESDLEEEKSYAEY